MPGCFCYAHVLNNIHPAYLPRKWGTVSDAPSRSKGELPCSRNYAGQSIRQTPGEELHPTWLVQSTTTLFRVIFLPNAGLFGRDIRNFYAPDGINRSISSAYIILPNFGDVNTFYEILSLNLGILPFVQNGRVLFVRNSQELAELIRTLASERNTSVTYMLKELSLGKNTLSAMQVNGGYPRIEALVKIADFLGVSIDYLIGRTDTPEVNR